MWFQLNLPCLCKRSQVFDPSTAAPCHVCARGQKYVTPVQLPCFKLLSHQSVLSYSHKSSS